MKLGLQLGLRSNYLTYDVWIDPHNIQNVNLVVSVNAKSANLNR